LPIGGTGGQHATNGFICAPGRVQEWTGKAQLKELMPFSSEIYCDCEKFSQSAVNEKRANT